MVYIHIPGVTKGDAGYDPRGAAFNDSLSVG